MITNPVPALLSTPTGHYPTNRTTRELATAPGERAFAQLKTWHILRKARCSTNRIGIIVAAIHTLLTCENEG